MQLADGFAFHWDKSYEVSEVWTIPELTCWLHKERFLCNNVRLVPPGLRLLHTLQMDKKQAYRTILITHHLKWPQV